MPVFFAPAEGPTCAGLTFRVGQADETLTTRGVSHLVEHLALHAVGQHHGPTNGAVCMLDTSFFIRAEPDDVSTFLASLTAALGDLPLHRLAAEARILETEAAGKGPSASAALLLYRFGPQGYGLPAQAELGLHQLGEDDVQRWAHERFTAENASLWIVGTLPDDLALHLEPGVWHAPPEPATIEPVRPGWFIDRPGVVALDAVVRRSDAANMALFIARQQVEDRLRHRDATSYSVCADIDTWTCEAIRLFLAADTLPAHASEVADGLVSTLDALASEGPSQAELDRCTREAAEAWAGPHVAGRLASGLAADRLLRRTSRPLARYLDDLRAVTAEEVRQAVEELVDDSLLLVPPGGEPGTGRHSAVAVFSASRIAGTELHRTTWYDEETAGNRLLVAPEGITYLIDAERPVTVRFADAQAVQLWTDGARTVIGADGYRIFVHPLEWDRGSWAVDIIDWATPPRLAVPMGADAGSRMLEEVARRAPPPPPPPPRSRWSKRT